MRVVMEGENKYIQGSQGSIVSIGPGLSRPIVKTIDEECSASVLNVFPVANCLSYLHLLRLLYKFYPRKRVRLRPASSSPVSIALALMV